MASSLANHAHPAILRRLASMLYESFLLLAVVFLAGFLFVSLTRGDNSTVIRLLFQAYLLLVVAAYFLWFWTHGGQTLAMKTWHLRLVSAEGCAMTWRQALLRFVFALPCVVLGIGLVWALFDRERQFLHDRLAGTRIIDSRT